MYGRKSILRFYRGEQSVPEYLIVIAGDNYLSCLLVGILLVVSMAPNGNVVENFRGTSNN